MNQLYNKARYQMVTGVFNWPALDLVLTAWGGTPNYVQTDAMLTDIIGRGLGVVLGHSLPVTTKSVAPDGTVQTNQVVIPTVPIGQNVTWFTFSKRAGVLTASEPLYYIDDADELPFVPNGLDLVINPDWVQARGWFRP